MQQAIVQIRDVEHFHWRLTETESPVAFSSNGNGMSLPAAIELACIAAANRQAGSDERATSVRVANCSVWTLVKATRWPERNTRVKMRDGDVAVVVLPQASDLWWLQCIRDLLSELKANGFPVKLAGALAGAVAEMADNVWLHSNTDASGLLAYQVRRRRFAFSVADTGIGVLASLRKNRRYHQLSSSMDAIRTAIEPGVSRFQDSGGMGFPSLLHAIADLWGTARIRSGQAGFTIDRTHPERRKHSSYLPELPGVHVSARCSLDAPSIYAQ